VDQTKAPTENGTEYDRAIHHYDLFDANDNVEFFVRYAKGATDAGPVLDVGAGTGRIAIPVTEMGVEVGTEYRGFVGREIRDDDTVAMTPIYEAYEDGEQVDRIVQPSRTAVVDREAVHHCLDATGAKVVREFADYDRTPSVQGDDLLVVAAKSRIGSG
jgi:hypothetical protein